jgi:hypothetical protein
MNTLMLGEGRIEQPLSTLGEPMSKIKEMDLFGNEVDQKPKLDDGFDEFWEAYPKCFRKGGKSSCKKKWVDAYYHSQKDIILKHLKWMATTTQWLKDNGAFIPAPKVYLNQQRWDGAEIPEIKPKEVIDPALAKIEADRKKATPMPEHIRARLAELRK